MPHLIMRHVQNQKIDGESILELPSKTEKVARVTLNKEERAEYNRMHDAAKAQYQQISSTERKKKTLQILSYLLPLRQACSGAEKKPTAQVKTEATNHVCEICAELAMDPVAAGCGHIFCRDCIGSLLSAGIGREPCPTCRVDITEAQLKAPVSLGVFSAASAATAAPTAAEVQAPSVFASKVNWLIEHLVDLRSEDSTSKVLVSCRFSTIFTAFRGRANLPRCISDASGENAFMCSNGLVCRSSANFKKPWTKLRSG